MTTTLETVKRHHIRKEFIVGICKNDLTVPTYSMVDGKAVKRPYYRSLQNMLQRTCCPKVHSRQPTYRNVTVCKEWLDSAEEFRLWFEAQYRPPRPDLDKDLLSSPTGPKVYSAETCLFIPKAINTLFSSNRATRGDYPQGVCWDKRDKKFQANLSINGKNKHIGSYDTAQDAEIAYLQCKLAHAKVVLRTELDAAIADNAPQDWQDRFYQGGINELRKLNTRLNNLAKQQAQLKMAA